MRKHFYIIVVACLLCAFGIQAQTIVKGTVMEAEGNMPIPSVTVIPNGNQNQGTVTDADGKFTLELSENSGFITVSFVGMKTKRVDYQGTSDLAIYLEQDINQLDDVVMIGYGSARRENLTSSVSSVSGLERINSRPVSNLSDFLQGNVPGVTVLQQGGDPSSNAQVVIRGIGSFSNEAPLTVVDGVPYYGPAINPNDIESVAVLKDAAAAAIYGAQAASGVIVIKTKGGALGAPKVSLDFYSGIQQASNLPTPLTAKQQADVYNLAADNAGVGRQSAHNATQNPWGQVNRTNWIDAIFRDAAIYNVNANVSGSTEAVQYLTSFGYHKKEGLLVGTDFERYSARLKADFFITDKLSIGENIYFSRSNAVGTNSSSSYSGSIISALYMPSAAPVRDENGEFHGVVPYDLSQFAGAYGDVYNPVALLLRPTTNNPINFFNANTYLSYEFIPGLEFKSTFSYSITDTKAKSFSPRIPELGRTNLQNYLNQSYSNTNRWVWENQLSYAKNFGEHDLNLTAIHSAQFTKYEGFSQQGRGFSSEEPFNQFMSNASEFSNPSSSVYEDALTSAIGRAMYSYDDRYFLTASIRRDETSRLAKDNQSSTFPSVSGAWKISSEPFFQNALVSNLKLRASWGQIGNINSVGYYSFDVPLSSQTLVLGEDASPYYKGVYVGRNSNLDLTWEISESTNFGVDASFLNGKVDVTLDYFVKTTKGMIIPGLEDLHQGTAAADVNGGEVENKGFEFAANYHGQIGQVRFNAGGNISALKNKLVNLDGYNSAEIDFISHGDEVRANLYPYRSIVGKPLYSTYLIPYEGIFQSQEEINAHSQNGTLIQPNALPGDFKFRDVNGDGRITDDDRVFMDAYQPKFTYSFNFNLEYKGFDASLIFQGVEGVKVFNGYKYTAYNASQQGYNLDNRVLGAWSETNKGSDIPRISTQDLNRNFSTNSSWYLEDASYLRLKNIVIGYTFPVQNIKALSGFDNLRVYISSENLFTITGYSGMDPEVGGKGLDVARYPVPKTFTAGLSLTF